ncbi:hypothetical protein NMY22_g8791 [Coprinellus aureogranulatus]|nr:hypothetical protein NMY22_g8791 [Coprinellus aureogranulatus]
MIATFKGVRKLAVYASDPVHPEHPCKPAVSLTFSNLRHLCIAIWDPERMFQWLLGSFSSIHLESLELQAFSQYHRGWGPVEHLNAFLASQSATTPISRPRRCVPSLEHVGIDAVHIKLSTSQLSTLTLRAHDLRAIRASLRTVSNQSLRQLRVEQMMWPFGQLCDCNEVEELRDRGEVMRCGTLSKASLQFGYRRGANLQALNTFEKHIETGSVEVFAAEVHNRFQPDTFEALSHRIVQRVTVISD